MRLMFHARALTTAGLVSLLMGSTALHAGPATPEGADRIKMALQQYFTAEQGVVAVTPGGEEYRIRLDFNPLLRKIPQMFVAASPMTMEATPQGNGRWKVSQHEKSFHLTAKMPTSNIEAKVSELEFTGTFDEALLAFSEGTVSLKDWEQTQTTWEETAGGALASPQKITTKTTSRVEKMTIAGTASGTAAALDQHTEISSTGALTTAEMNVPMGEAQPMPFTYILKGENSKTVADVQQLNAQGMAGLVTFFASRPAGTSLAATQNKLREQLGAAIPLFKSVKFTNTTLSQSAELKGAGTTTQVSVPQIQTTVSVSGLGADGQLSIVSALKDLAITSDAWGDWVTPLVPTALDLSFSAKGFDLDAAAKLVVSTFDLTASKPFPDSFAGQLLGAVLPQGSLGVSLDSLTLSSPVATFTMTGKVNALTKGAPDASASIALKGYDAMMSALARGPQTQNMVTATGMLGLIRSYARADASGSTVIWDIKATQKEGILVNDRVVVPGEPPATPPPAPSAPETAPPVPTDPAPTSPVPADPAP